MRDIKFRAWDGERFYSPIIDGNHIYRDWRDYEDGVYTTDPLMQYTGLKDKNGIEIFEGDILIHVDTNWGYGGEYDKKNDGYLRTIILDVGLLLSGDFEYEPGEFKKWEVIGNIHNNPELIK